MARFAYVNGRYVPHDRAMISIEDRGFQFADSVYEVITVLGGEFVDEDGHMARLSYSLGELRITLSLGMGPLRSIMRTLVRRNRLAEGYLYMQITRGQAPRDFKFPAKAHSTLVMTTRRAALPPTAATRGVKVVTVPDIRWARRDIKSTGLLAQVLAKQAAVEADAFEAWMIDDEGYVTEGASSNAWIVTRDGVLVTRQADHSVLYGITGNSIQGLAAELGIRVERRPFSLTEAMEAREAFLSSATTFCVPIVAIDSRPVANGHPGTFSQTLLHSYLDYARDRMRQPFPWEP